MGRGRDAPLQAAFSGVANAVITADHFDVPVSYEGLAAIGSGLGSAGFVVYDDTACMVDVARTLSRFLYVESCGQCRACKFGTGEITRNLDAIAAGDGTDQHVEIIGARLLSVTDQTALLPRGGGAGARLEHPAGLPRGVRAPPRGAVLRASHGRSPSPSSSTWRTASPPTTSARPASSPTGPTSMPERADFCRHRATC